MKTTLLVLATAAALGVLAGCDRNEEPRGAAAGASGAAPSAPQSSIPTTPANAGQPQSQAEKREGANPVQQQVDPKEPEQRRDFQQKGDAAGPKPGG